MRSVLVFLLGIASAGFLPAQQVDLAGPVEAFTFDAPTRSIRAVLGIPGAASFGAALYRNLDFAAVAPNHNYAIGFQNGRCVFVSGLGSGPAVATQLSGVAEPDGIAWSADGSHAVLYSRAGNWFQFLEGFPRTPSVAPVVDLSSLRGMLTSVATDAHGSQIAFGVRGEKPGVYRTSDTQSFEPVLAVSNPIALSFSGDGRSLYVLDGTTFEILALSLGNGSLQAVPLHGLVDPVAILSALGPQNRPLLYVAGRGDHLLRILDPTSGQVLNDIRLRFRPDALDPLGSNSFILGVRSEATRPLWLFRAGPQPGAYFVPAIAQSPANSGAGGISGSGGTQ